MSIAIRRLLPGLLLLVWACAGQRPAPPSADRPQAPPPPLFGRAVFVLPAQPAPGQAALPGLDADLAFFLAERVAGVRWVFPPEVERVARNAPGLDIRPGALAVSAFHGMKLERIGDPLFGELHSLGVMLDARFALLPWAAAFVPGRGGGQGRIEIAAALIDTSDGDVLWSGVVAGEPAAAVSPAATASAAAALAQLLAR